MSSMLLVLGEPGLEDSHRLLGQVAASLADARSGHVLRFCWLVEVEVDDLRLVIV